MGDHVPGEMGGLWLHPIKLIDGFWGEVTDVATDQAVALSEANEFVTYPYGSRFRYGPVLDGLEIERFQFAPDGRQGVIVQYQFRNRSDRKRTLRFQLAVKTDLRPVWFSEQLGIEDAPDAVAWEATDQFFVAKDDGHTWFSAWGAVDAPDAQPIATPQPIHTSGKGVTAAARYSVSVDANGTAALTFVIAGSARDKAEALAGYRYLARNHGTLLAEKKSHYAAVLERARVTIPDRRLQEAYNWVKVDAEWLVRDVPGLGRGLGAGLMEYPWWFGTETLFPAGAHGDRRFRPRQADAPPVEESVHESQRQRADPARADDQRRGFQSRQHPGDGPVHPDGRTAVPVEAKLTDRDRESIGYYERLKQKFSALPDSTRGWLTNKNWVITTPMEAGIAPQAKAIRLLDRIRRENVGDYGPFLSAVERQAMMTISTGVQAVSEANYGRTEEALGYVDKIVQTLNRTTPGSISEMMPDYGCFAIAWTSYGIVVPLIGHIFGIQPDAVHRTVVFGPHVPAGWKDMSIEDLPVGSNTAVSFSRR